MVLSRQVHDQLDRASKEGVTAIPCDCVEASPQKQPDLDCVMCSGLGIVYEYHLDKRTSDAIEENLRSQGVPLGKEGMN